MLPTYTVRYLEVYGNYVTLHARRDYTVKRTLADFEKGIGGGLYRVGRFPYLTSADTKDNQKGGYPFDGRRSCRGEPMSRCAGRL